MFHSVNTEPSQGMKCKHKESCKGRYIGLHWQISFPRSFSTPCSCLNPSPPCTAGQWQPFCILTEAVLFHTGAAGLVRGSVGYCVLPGRAPSRWVWGQALTEARGMECAVHRNWTHLSSCQRSQILIQKRAPFMGYGAKTPVDWCKKWWICWRLIWSPSWSLTQEPY